VVTGHQPDDDQPIHYWTLSPSLHPLLHPAHHEPTHLTVGQGLQKDSERDGIKSLTKIQKNSIHHLPFISKARDLVIEGYHFS